MMRPRIWEDVPTDEARVAPTAERLKVPPVIARLLCQRGFDEPEAARRFLAPSLADLHDPFLLTGMREAVLYVSNIKHNPNCIGGVSALLDFRPDSQTPFAWSGETFGHSNSALPDRKLAGRIRVDGADMVMRSVSACDDFDYVVAGIP